MERDNKGQFVKPFTGGRMDGWARGMNNMRANLDMPADMLRLVANADMLESGRVRRRRGIRQVVADANAHSVFGTSDYLYWATANTLKRCNVNYTPTTLLTSSSLSDPISYVERHDGLYFSNEKICGRIVDGVYEPWGSATTITPESATTDVTGVRTLVTPLGTFKTEPYGTEFFNVVTGVQLTVYPLVALPPGQLVEDYKGRLYVASGSVLYYSEPLFGAYMQAKNNFIMFPARITLMKAVDDGIYISADQTYFLHGTPGKDMKLEPILPYKAIEGSSSDLPNQHDIAWLSERGLIYGKDGGEMTNVTEDNMAVDKTARACTGVFEYDGAKHLITIMREGETSPLASKDYVAAEADRVKDRN